MPRWYKKKGMPVTLEFIWSRVDKTGDCWIWLGSKFPKGYGALRNGGKDRQGVHRLVYALTYGPISDGMQVLHKCDNPPCCRPEHLFLGTHRDNMRDMTAKGRNIVHAHPERLARGLRNGAYTHPEQRRRGEGNGRARLTQKEVSEARRLYATGNYLLKDLAKKYGFSISGIHHAISSHTWKHLPQETIHDTQDL